MKPDASTTSFADVRDARAIRVLPGSTFRWKTTSCAFSPQNAFRTSCSDLAWKKAFPSNRNWYLGQIESAQKRVEGQNFSYRKHVLEYDDVMNKQREAIYGLRRQLLEGEGQKEYIMRMADEIMDSLVEQYAPANVLPGQWDLGGLATAVREQFGFDYVAEGIDAGVLSAQGTRRSA
jgi:preprotein translocase subunit SecA